MNAAETYLRSYFPDDQAYVAYKLKNRVLDGNGALSEWVKVFDNNGQEHGDDGVPSSIHLPTSGGAVIDWKENGRPRHFEVFPTPPTSPILKP